MMSVGTIIICRPSIGVCGGGTALCCSYCWFVVGARRPVFCNHPVGPVVLRSAHLGWHFSDAYAVVSICRIARQLRPDVSVCFHWNRYGRSLSQREESATAYEHPRRTAKSRKIVALPFEQSVAVKMVCFVLWLLANQANHFTVNSSILVVSIPFTSIVPSTKNSFGNSHRNAHT